jgi:sigma-B regulation protein RsbU (phosphoserine phosphatase)
MNAIRRQSLPRVDFADPGQVLQGLNSIFQMDDHDGMYFSIWYGIYDRRTRQLTYSSAGHPPAILLGADDRARRMMTKGMAVGVLPECRIPCAVERVSAGDRLYLFSDGVYEIVTRQGAEWSFEEFEREVCAHRGPVDQEAGRIFARVREISNKADFDDDFSLVVMEFHE